MQKVESRATNQQNKNILTFSKQPVSQVAQTLPGYWKAGLCIYQTKNCRICRRLLLVWTPL